MLEVINVKKVSTSKNEQSPLRFSSGILEKLQMEQNSRPGPEVSQASSFNLPKLQRVAQFSTLTRYYSHFNQTLANLTAIGFGIVPIFSWKGEIQLAFNLFEPTSLDLVKGFVVKI